MQKIKEQHSHCKCIISYRNDTLKQQLQQLCVVIVSSCNNQPRGGAQ